MTRHTPQPWDPNADPTPQELADWLKACTDEERLHVAQQAIRNAEMASRCFLMNHDNHIAHLEHGHAAP